jgi:phospholipase/lecithinase/hemolysin
MTRYIVRLLVFITLSASLLAGTAHAQVPQIPRFDALYVFGDSLVDNGNDLAVSKLIGSDPLVPPSTSPHRTYFQGRFSNGYVGVEYLWQSLSGHAPGTAQGLKPFLSQPLFPLGPAVDFAFGDTGTRLLDQVQGGVLLPGLRGQIELYLNSPQPWRRPRRPLFVIVTGSNDYSGDAPLSVPRVVGNIADAVRTLYRDGARDVMVVNLPDLGLVPANLANSAIASQLSFAHNAALKIALDALDAGLPGLNIIQPDLVALFNSLPAGLNRTLPALDFLFFGDPTIPAGFHMSACLFIDPVSCRDVPHPELVFNATLPFVFWDVVHPTHDVQRAFGQYMLASLGAYYSR